MRLEVIDARRGQSLGLLRGFGGSAGIETAEANLHRVAGGCRGQVRDPRAADQHARADDLAFANPVTDGETVGQRRSEIYFGRDAGHQQLSGRRPHHLHQHLPAAMAGDPGEPRRVVAMPEHDEVAVGLDESRQHGAAAGVHDRRIGRNLHVRRRAGLDDRVAFDEHRRVMDRRDLVAGQQHAADEREMAWCLRARRQRGQQQRGGDDGRARGPSRAHAKIPSGSNRPLSTAAVSS